MPQHPRTPRGVYCRKEKQHNMTDIMVETVDFIQRRELSAALQAATALHDALALNGKSGFQCWPRPEMPS